MNPIYRARRVGFTAILCALLLRLWAAGLPEAVASFLAKPNITAFLLYLETGHRVRFSPSLEAFSPDFMESPPPFLPEPTEAPLPSFSGAEEIELYYAAKVSPEIADLLEKPLTWDLGTEEPSVLILHTHTTESYTRQQEDYKETSPWRTLDERYNMLSLGAALADTLEAGGLQVLRDTQTHDYPSYNGSYSRSRKSLRTFQKENPSLQLILDLHRDASGGEGRQMRPLAGDCAQLMVVIGANHEAYEENLSLGLKLHAQLESQVPGIMRPLQIRASRFNQDLSPGALLIEVGAAGNTHPEALRAVEELAKAILALSRGTV